MSINILENFSLKDLNTFRVAVNAAFFTEVKSVEELRAALRFAEDKGLAHLIIGGGSNILFTQDFDGLVVRMNLRGIKEKNKGDGTVEVTAAAGENWHGLVQHTLSQNLGGLENLSLIPGSVGAAPMQNIGAYGVEIKNTFLRCTVYDLQKETLQVFDKEKCDFGYRESIFKKEGKGRYIVLDVTFLLRSRNHHIKTEYGAIRQELAAMGIESPTIQQVSEAVIRIRRSKLPDPKVLGNAGSFFKNPSIPATAFEKLKNNYPEMPGYANGNLVKIPAGWLIEQCGWKGKQVGNVATHNLQSLVIINKTGEASGEEIFKFSAEIIASVQKNFSLTLEREVNVL